MAPSTPPPPKSELLAALTMASASTRVMSPRMSSSDMGSPRVFEWAGRRRALVPRLTARGDTVPLARGARTRGLQRGDRFRAAGLRELETDLRALGSVRVTEPGRRAS